MQALLTSEIAAYEREMKREIQIEEERQGEAESSPQDSGCWTLHVSHLNFPLQGQFLPQHN